MRFDFKNSENEKYGEIISSEFLKHPNPFPRNPVCSKSNLPKFCIGRIEEIGIIKNAIEKVSSSMNKESAWIPINGSGGTGKSTIALYVYDSAKNKKSKDLDIDYLECSYFDCPSELKFLTITNFYQKIFNDLGNPPSNFPYFLGYEFIKKLFEFFSKSKVKDEFIRTFTSVLQLSAKHSNPSDFLLEIKHSSPNYAKKLKKFINDNDYIISENEKIKLEIDYMEILIDLVSNDTKKRKAAQSKIKGKEIKNEEEAIQMIENLISVLNFLFKKSCLLIIIDNFEQLPEDKKAFKALFKLLLKFRTRIKNCLLLTIGSTDFWNIFNENFNESDLNMLSGFRYDYISLKNISSIDASKIMDRYLREFWDLIEPKNRPKGDDFRYPFSMDAFEYIHEINGRNLRESLKYLYKIVEGYKNTNRIDYIKDTKDSIFYLRPKTQEIYLMENELVFLKNFISNYPDRNQLSRNIELGLIQAFLEIKNKSTIGKMIYDVKHEPRINIDSGSFAKPDVYLKLFGDESMQDLKNIEISVKAYYSSNKVPLSETKGSFDLLKERKIDYLTFLTLSPLENKVIEDLKDYGPQIGRISKLTTEEASYLLLITKEFSELFFDIYPLDFDKYIQILNKIGIDFKKFLEKIRKIKIEQQSIKTITSDDDGIKTVKGGKDIPKSPKRPKTPEEKISNPEQLEPILIKKLEEAGFLSKKQDIIDYLIPYAKSQNVINNMITNLKGKNMLEYSRKKKGWFLI